MFFFERLEIFENSDLSVAKSAYLEWANLYSLFKFTIKVPNTKMNAKIPPPRHA
jgi:hypothetical protein